MGKWTVTSIEIRESMGKGHIKEEKVYSNCWTYVSSSLKPSLKIKVEGNNAPC